MGVTAPVGVRRRIDGGLSLLSGAAVLSAGLLLAGGLNFLFHVVSARMLSPAAYGGLAGLLAALNLAGMALATVQTSVTVWASRLGGRVPVGDPARKTTAATVAAALVLLVLAAPLSRFFHLDSPEALLLAGAFLVPAGLAAVARGVLLARLSYAAVAVSVVAGAVAKLLLTAVLLPLTGDPGAALAAIVGGELVGAGVATLAVLRRRVAGSGAGPRWGWPELRGPAATVIGFWLLAMTDAVLAPYLLGPEAAGPYEAAATLGKVGLFASQAVAMTALPRFARRGVSHRQVRLVAAAAGLAGLVATAPLLVAPTVTLPLVMGAGYQSGWLPALLAWAGVQLGVALVFLYAALGRGAGGAVVPWVGAAVLAAAIGRWHSGPEQVAMLVVVVSGLATVVLAVLDRRRAADPEPPLVLTDAAEGDLTVVVPFYNPGPAVRRHVIGILQVLERSGIDFEVIAVADGCTDGSERHLEDLRSERLRLVTNPSNGGKGAALRTGLALGRGRYLGFIDGDGDLAPELLAPFVTLMQLYRPDAVVGSKLHPLSRVEYPPHRRVMSWGYRQLVRALFRLNIRDTQTGIKLFRRDLLQQVLPQVRERGFVFDLELLVLARRMGFSRIMEAPVQLTHRFISTVGPHTALRMLADTLQLFARVRLGGYRPGTADASNQVATPLHLTQVTAA